MDKKAELIEWFLGIIDKNEEFKKFIDIKKARQILIDNIREVVENVEMESKNEYGHYDFWEKKIRLKSEIDLDNLSDKEKGILFHEMLHALTTKIPDLEKGKSANGFSGIQLVKIFQKKSFGRLTIGGFEKRRL